MKHYAIVLSVGVALSVACVSPPALATNPASYIMGAVGHGVSQSLDQAIHYQMQKEQMQQHRQRQPAPIQQHQQHPPMDGVSHDAFMQLHNDFMRLAKYMDRVGEQAQEDDAALRVTLAALNARLSVFEAKLAQVAEFMEFIAVEALKVNVKDVSQ